MCVLCIKAYILTTQDLKELMIKIKIHNTITYVLVLETLEHIICKGSWILCT